MTRAMTLRPSWTAIAVAGLVVVAFVLRLALLPRDGVINGDGIYYATLGKRLVSGDLRSGMSTYWSPFYPFLVGVSSLFFDDLEFAGRFVSVVAGALLVVPTYGLVRDLQGRVPAVAAAVAIAVHPMLIQSSGWVMTESVYGLVFITAVWVGWRALRDGGARAFAATGVLLGVAYLTKPEAIGFLALFVALTLAGGWLRSVPARRALARHCALLALGFAVAAAPYLLFLQHRTGRWTLSEKLMMNTSAAGYDRGMLNLSDDGRTTMMDRLFGNADTEQGPAPRTVGPTPSTRPRVMRTHSVPLGTRFVRQLVKQITQHTPQVLPYPLIALALVGFVVRPWTRARVESDVYLLSFVACTLVGYALTVIELRYAFATTPILVGWAAAGAAAAIGFAARFVARHVRRIGVSLTPGAMAIATAVVLVASLAPSYRRAFASPVLATVPLEERRAGLWLRDHADGPTAVMASSPTAAFYAGARHVFVPDESLSAVLAYAHRQRIAYLVFAERRLKSTRSLLPLDTVRLTRALRLVYRDARAPGYGVSIYELTR